MTANLLSWVISAYQILAALPEFVDDHSGALIAVATIAIAWFTFTLKRSSVKMWRVTNDAITLLERPKIGAYNTTFKNISMDYVGFTSEAVKSNKRQPLFRLIQDK